MSKVVSIAAAVVLSLSCLGAQAQNHREGVDDRPSSGAMVFDLIIVRPLGLVSTVAGAGLFVVSLPFTALQGGIGDAAQKLVGDPAHFTFVRPLGENP